MRVLACAAVAALVLLMLTGCTVYVPIKVDDQWLKDCQPVPELKGTTGKDVAEWSKEAGPVVVECRQLHNGLVKILKAQN